MWHICGTANGMGRHGLDCLAQDRDRWQAIVNAVIKLQVPENVENFLTS
jgi:hypothetical protein